MTHAQDHFSAIASQYALGRIAYPEDLYRFLATQCHVQDLAWDCATGSGQAALDLVRKFSRVIATDISKELLALAPRHPRIHWPVVAPEVDRILESFKSVISSSWPERSAILHGGYSSIRPLLEEISSPAFEASAQWKLDDYLAHLRSWSATRYYRERTGEDITLQFQPAFVAAWRDARIAVKWPLVLRVFQKG